MNAALVAGVIASALLCGALWGEEARFCPLGEKAKIRPGDACASQGGAYNAQRAGGKFHFALDLNAKEGDGVHAVRAGKVAVATNPWGELGGTVIIDHGDGDYSIYGHLGELSVTKGETVLGGAVIGQVGFTGNASCLKAKHLPPHLHFAIFKAGQSGLAGDDKPLSRLREWGDAWQANFPQDILLVGPVSPTLVLGDLDCWEK